MKMEDFMEYVIDVSWDEESQRWMGINDRIPVAFDAETLEELIRNIQLAASEVISLNHLPPAKSFLFMAEKRVGALA